MISRGLLVKARKLVEAMKRNSMPKAEAFSVTRTHVPRPSFTSGLASVGIRNETSRIRVASVPAAPPKADINIRRDDLPLDRYKVDRTFEHYFTRGFAF